MIQFDGSLKLIGSEPHLIAWIATADGLAYLLDPEQQATLGAKLSTGMYHWKAYLKPKLASLAGLIPAHDAVAHIQDFEALDR